MPLARSTAPRPSARRDGVLAFTALAGALAVLVLLTDAGLPALVASGVLGLAVLGAVVRSTVRRSGEPYGPADRITVGRSVLVALAAALLPVGLAAGPGQEAGRPVDAWCWAVFAVALPAWLLDGIDGWVARRTGTATRAGARFDQEVDAALLLILSVAVAARIGLPEACWVVTIGALRYLFLLGLRVRPPWRRELPYSRYRRVVAGIQGGVLIGALVPPIPLPLAVAATVLALVLLLVSFGRDVLWLERGARGLS
ncbi:CDP-alcohol phosphatidyltransferase family protein [Kocuria sp. NPDC057446]|uniref:CDP-alcohol phosphatidyltransferase family protein n=1 Tax=Kocuria sp. NPDC057446 TaxID=3346137 RepID=UPI0036AD57E4